MKDLKSCSTSIIMDSEILNTALELEINVSAVMEAALLKAITKARRDRWLKHYDDALEWPECPEDEPSEILPS